jgi:glucose-1-phosphate thymidylyltransferase
MFGFIKNISLQALQFAINQAIQLDKEMMVKLCPFDHKVIEFAREVKPSSRGELEITSLLQRYLDIGELNATILDRGTVWLDTGTFESFHHASSYVQVVQERQGLKIGSIEEIAWRMGFISDEQLSELAVPLVNSGYGRYLQEQLRYGR